MGALQGTVALVTGATRSVGRGIALALGEAGATVYLTGRSISDKDAQRITDAGGRGIAIPCDHSDDAAVQRVFDEIAQEAGRLDILVNNAWGGYTRLRNRKENPGFSWKNSFWKQPLGLWDDMFRVGVRSNYIAGVLSARLMVQQQRGLIVNISFFAGRRYYGNVAYGTAKAAVDRMTQDMALELKPFKVAAVSLYPGYIAEKKPAPNPKKESPIFVGRAIAAMAADPKVMSKSGSIQVAAQLAREYGFTDIDGTQPDPYDEL